MKEHISSEIPRRRRRVDERLMREKREEKKKKKKIEVIHLNYINVIIQINEIYYIEIV